MENLLYFFEDIKDLFWIVDEQYRLIYGNKTYFAYIKSAYNTNIKKGDVLLNLEQFGSDSYLFWKNCYDKAQQTHTFSVNFQLKNTATQTKFDFKLVNNFVSYVCIRGTEITTQNLASETKLLAANDVAVDKQLTFSVDSSGDISAISENLKNILGYYAEFSEKKPFANLLHPEERDIVLTRFTKQDKVLRHWCRMKIASGDKYIWCNFSTERSKLSPQDKGFNITVLDLRLQSIPYDGFVPEVNLLEVIAETQQIYITYNSLEKAVQPCLSYLHGLGLSNFSFIATLDWKGLQPALHIPATYGSLPHFTSHLTQLLQYLSFLCSDAQRDLNNNTINQINEGFNISFLGENFTVYNLVNKSKLLGVWVVSSLQQKELLAQQSLVVSYLRAVITPLLHSNKFSDDTNSIIHNLSAGKDELLSLVASLDDIVFELNQSFEFVNIWCNSEALLPRPKDQMIGKSLRQVYNPDFALPFETAITRVIASSKSENIEFKSEVKNEKKWFMAQLNYVKLFSGEVRVSMMVRDITERKLAEVAVAKAFAKEKEFNEMKSKMIQSVSHEFRTPLATVVSSTELLEMYIKKNYSVIGERAGELFTTIYEEIERLSDMMRNFLVMGRFEENQTPFRPKAVDIHALIPRIIRTRFQIKYGDEKVQFTASNRPKQAEIDESLFWHIVTNIVSNAIKYSPEKEPVFVHLEYKEEGFDLSVQDRGIGIPEKDLPNIFQSFYRAGNSEDHSGYGLGLSIVERFVKMHQATIEVVSKEGLGTTFILHFKYQII